MARVHWEACCEGFCSKEGPHYWIEKNARNQMERNQVQRAPEKSLGSCRQTSNNQPYSRVWKSLGDSFPRLYCIDLVELMSHKKMSVWGFRREKKVWFAIAQWTFMQVTFRKRRNGERMPVLILVPGSHKHLTLRKWVKCARNMGAHVRRSIQKMKGIRTGWEIGVPRNQEGCEETSK